MLLLAFVPLLARWLTGAAGRVTTGDVLIALHCLWVALALIVLHGAERIPYAGITIIEIFGSYLLGRLLIRNATDYRLLFRNFLLALVILAPFVAVEMVTSKLVLSQILDKVADTHPKLQAGADNMRMGLYRAQGVLEHPILWGVFCSMGIANVFYIHREKLFRSAVLTGFVTGMTFTSLSSGPLLAAAVQIGIIGWGWITRNAWWVLIGLAVLGYVVVDLISNRTPVQVLITYLTFNSGSAYWRLHIFTYGSAEVWRHPLLGIGLNDWQRPDWMGTASVDNFWLLTAMRYGLPAFLLLVAGIAANLVQIVRQPGLGGRLADLRRGHVIATIGLAMTLGTVHAWGATLVFVMFYFGAGSWIFTATPSPATADPVSGTPARAAARMPDRTTERKPAARAPAGAGGSGRRRAPAPPRQGASGADPPKPSAWRAGARSIRAAAAPTAEPTAEPGRPRQPGPAEVTRTPMLDVVRKLFLLLNAKERQRFYAVMMLALVSGMLEMVSVAAILPFLAVLSDPTRVETHAAAAPGLRRARLHHDDGLPDLPQPLRARARRHQPRRPAGLDLRHRAVRQHAGLQPLEPADGELPAPALSLVPGPQRRASRQGHPRRGPAGGERGDHAGDAGALAVRAGAVALRPPDGGGAASSRSSRWCCSAAATCWSSSSPAGRWRASAAWSSPRTASASSRCTRRCPRSRT